MSSIIPKISIGRDTKKGNHFDLSSMTHTTSEIGYVQPTFSKNIVPGSNVRIGTRTGVRLSPLFVPTMGQLDVRHYHCYVPFNTLWFPFDSFITQTNYTLPDGTTYTPKVCPSFTLKGLLTSIFGSTTSFSGAEYANINIMRQDLVCTFYELDTLHNQLTRMSYEAASGMTSDIFTSADLGYLPETIVQPTGQSVERMMHIVNGKVRPDTARDNIVKDLPIPNITHCDFSLRTTLTINEVERTFIICYNFSGTLKRVRSIFLGLGYSFNPFDTQDVTLFKLLAFYKSYWNLFGVNRTFNFYNTACYKLIKHLSDNAVTQLTITGTPVAYALLVQLIGDLCDCTYTTPVDYFSSADTTTQRGSSIVGRNIGVQDGVFAQQTMNGSNVANIGAYPDSSSGNKISATDASNPLSQKIALRLLRFVNKNSVIGRQISEILRTRYGVTDIHNTTHEDIIKVGANSVPVQISAVYNNTDSGDMPLGAYAGLGVGSHRSKMFKFSADSFGVLITLTAVVPKMGYFQGMFRENSDGIGGSLDFYTPEFDAIGWQSIRYNEMIADRQHQYFDNSNVGTNLGIWGYTPFYQHLKVGMNRCLGDISIPHLRDSMLPYTLDRYFPENGEGSESSLPGDRLLPVNDPQTFRSGIQGNTNRIFSDTSKTDDHIIMQIFFDVKMSAPMKSIATSYDTWDDESTQSVDVAHE